MPLDIPKVKANKKTYLIAGSAAAAFVAYRWYQARASASVAAATPTDTTMGSGSVTDAAGGSYGPGNVQYGGADITTPSETPTTNAQWTALAVQALINTGYDGATVQAALGRYLTDQGLTTDQETIVRAAIAVAGNPPVGTHTINKTPTMTTPTPTGTVPIAPGGFYNVKIAKTTANVGWGPVGGATGYDVFAEWTGKTYPVSTTRADFRGLKGNTVHRYKVRARNAAGSGPWSSIQWFRTQK